MPDKAVDWLGNWAGKNNTTPRNAADEKATMRDPAKTCIDDAQAAGFTVQDIKDAAGGDLETYLLDHRARSRL